jgi:type II secretory pathway pseudopilin PulG
MRTQDTMPTTWGYTLAQALVLMAIVGVLVAIIVPRVRTRNSGCPGIANLRAQLQTIRSQMELYNVQNPANPYDDTVAAPGDETFWGPLLQGNYLQIAPINPLTDAPANNPSAVNAAAAPGGAWVWAELTPGDPWGLNIYAVDEDGNLYSDPDTGTPY